MSEALTVKVSAILDDYCEEVERASREITQKVAKEAAQKLKQTSPQKTGKYAKGWKVKKESDSTYILHNATSPGLTHLLEFGHVIRNKKGTFGRAPAHPHIAAVERWAKDELVDRLEKKL